MFEVSDMVDDGSVSDESSAGKRGGYHSSDGNSTSGRSHDESSTTGTSITGSHRGGRDIPDDIIAREESKAVAMSRILVLIVLAVSAAAAGVATFVLSKKAEMADFQLQVRCCYTSKFSPNWFSIVPILFLGSFGTVRMWNCKWIPWLIL